MLVPPASLFLAASAAMGAETRNEQFHNRLFVPATMGGIRVAALLASAADFPRRTPGLEPRNLSP